MLLRNAFTFLPLAVAVVGFAGCGGGSGGGGSGGGGSGGGSTDTVAIIELVGMPTETIGAPGILTVVPQNEDFPNRLSTHFWDFGDGARVREVIDTYSHQYTESGTYTVTVEILDLSNRVFARGSHQVTVDLTPPTLSLDTLLVRGEISRDAAVTAGGVNDRDGTTDQNFEVPVALDGETVIEATTPTGVEGNLTVTTTVE